MRKLISTLSIIILFIGNLSSQVDSYSYYSIEDSLLKNANAVIRNSEYHLIISDDSEILLKVKKAITILNQRGNYMAELFLPYSKYSKVKFIKGKVFDKFGLLINEIKKTDILDNSYRDGFSLYTDVRYKLVKSRDEKFPYTIEYEYEMEYDGTFQFPNWYPISSYNISVEHAQLLISSFSGYKFRSKSVNYLSACKKTADKKYEYYKWNIDYYKAVKKEQFNNSILNIVPYIIIAPSDFEIDDYAGNADTWENIGKWLYTLSKGRYLLSEEKKNEIYSLINNISDDKEKAKIVYENMQSETRYVNISLGIGGLQPNKAIDTERNGYGDCKALSVYTKALLDVAGINSNYAIVKAGRNTAMINSDFPSFQFNHAILCLFFENDTIWLECTSQNSPFGYIGTFTDDRDVLIIDSNNTGKIVHTTVYPQNVNTQNRNANFIVDDFGNITGKVKTIFSGIQYENVNSYMNQSKEEQKKKLEEELSVPNMKIKGFSFVENKNIIPSINENLDIVISNYATISSNRLFLVPIIFNKSDFIPKKITKRKTEIVFKRGYIDIDTITYIIPKGYVIEYLPESAVEKNKYGSLTTTYIFKNQELTYIRKWSINKGKFPSSEYDNIRDFFKLIYNSDKETIVFIKNE